MSKHIRLPMPQLGKENAAAQQSKCHTSRSVKCGIEDVKVRHLPAPPSVRIYTINAATSAKIA
ncbi:hypothetical protein [Bacteroides helcogenes]|uniref:hypothetical protein n=1 Tax=Bacteroides helcogenes TaxID=290053 RepID=UPI0011D2A83A|nr:hypothetical protein [Bacteroides helcogenes]MDY5237814.1 hypothetical protein [Bacteroides helcogenes]